MQLSRSATVAPTGALSRSGGGLDFTVTVEKTERLTLEQREDVRAAQKSLKLLRGLCKEYGLSFRVPQGSAFGGDRRGRRLLLGDSTRERLQEAGRDGASASSRSSPSCSSSFEFSSEEEKDGLAEHTKWESVKELLDGLQTARRVRAIKDISSSLASASKKAEGELLELDELERRRKAGRGIPRAAAAAAAAPAAASSAAAMEERASTAGGEGEGDGEASAEEDQDEGVPEAVDEGLLNFELAETPAAHALQRCIGLVPELRRLAGRKKEARRAALLKAQEERPNSRSKQENRSTMEDSETEEPGLAGEVERKLRSLGDLPPGTDPDLKVVLEAQKAEARALVLRIKESEREAQVKRMALDFVDGKLVTENAETELINAAIGVAQELKAAVLAEKKAEADRRLREDPNRKAVPTEKDVKAVLDECARLRKEVDRASEQVKRMQEIVEVSGGGEAEELLGPTSRGQAGLTPQPPGGEPPAGPRRRPALKQGVAAETSSFLTVSLDKVGEIFTELQQESAELDEKIAVEDRRIAAAEGLLRNAEHSLKVLEECKILFLEQVATEKPALIEELLRAEAREPGAGDAAEDESSGLSGSEEPQERGAEAGADDEEEGESQDEEVAKRLLALGAEERWLRAQIAEVEAEDEAEAQAAAAKGEEPAASKGQQERTASKGQQEEGGEDGGQEEAEEPLVQDIWKLVRRVEAEVARTRGTSPEGCEESEDVEEDAEYEAVKHLSRDEAAQRLRQLPHKELRSLLALRDQNQHLMEKITEARQELERLRAERGATEALLGEAGVPGTGSAGGPGDGGQAPSPELVAEVRRKVRELHALRRRWWSERQDPATTVRRALAAVGLPEVEGVEDEPPASVQVSLFDRIRQSMTLP